MGNYLLGKFLLIPGILIAFTAKEYVRARVAYKLGDKAQKFQGRMTLDPFAHIDPIGFIMIILMGFGWSKPAYVNRNALKNPKRDSLIVTIAAFSSYLIVGLISAIIYVVILKTGFFVTTIGQIVGLVFWYIFSVNISLFVFNLIPMPGLEMFNILSEVVPGKAYRIMEFVSRNQMVILIVLVVGARFILTIPVGIVSSFIQTIAFFIVGIFL